MGRDKSKDTNDDEDDGYDGSTINLEDERTIRELRELLKDDE